MSLKENQSAQSHFSSINSSLRPISVDYDLKAENSSVFDDVKMPSLSNDYNFEKHLDRSSYLFLSMFYENNEDELVAGGATSKSFEFNSNDDLMSKSEPCMNFNSSFTISDFENDNCDNNYMDIEKCILSEEI